MFVYEEEQEEHASSHQGSQEENQSQWLKREVLRGINLIVVYLYTFRYILCYSCW